jgi:hypothetical protein
MVAAFFYFGICLENPNKTHESLNHDSRFPGQDLNAGLPDYEGVPALHPRR